MPDSVKSAARAAERHPALRALARGGYVATGVVHLLVGVIALVVAWSRRGESDQAGALTAIADVPLGFLGLWVIAALLWALGAYHAIHGIAVRIDSRPKRWGRRLAEWGQAAVFLAMGSLAAAVALGARPNAEQSAENAGRGVLAFPGGPFLLTTAGLAIGIGGIVFIVMGARRSFRARLDLPSGAAGHWISGLGAFGFIAKGIALVVICVLVCAAAVQDEPQLVSALDGAIRTLRELPAGPALVAAVGVGFVSYGVFCGFRARYAEL
ncbi:DUF1206 domain-containing protein [Leucobacter celer]|uniref:DUF1206 domain-containing protein n=1 Tax=Leucobacter celer TaxID=668625 RepID=UPI0009497A30|nr:DUF1206 domain-containing protein [Leucobacter celer]